MLRTVFLLLCTIAVLAACSLHRPKRLIFILAGQSNMSGRGDLAAVPDFANRKRIFTYSNAGKWVAGREPVDFPRGQIDDVSRDDHPGAGPGMAFADRLAALLPCAEIGLVPAAKGSTPIAAWLPNPSRATLYGSMIARAKEAEAEGTLAGMIWWQGEADENQPAAAAAWPGRFNEIVQSMRADLKAPHLPVIMTVLAPGKWPAQKPNNDAFVAKQQAMQLPPDTVRVSAHDMKTQPHSPHLTTAGYIKMGRRYAEAMITFKSIAGTCR